MNTLALLVFHGGVTAWSEFVHALIANIHHYLKGTGFKAHACHVAPARHAVGRLVCMINRARGIAVPG